MDAWLNFFASVTAFAAMYLFGKLTAERAGYRDGHRDGYRDGLEYTLRALRIAQAESAKESADRRTPEQPE